MFLVKNKTRVKKKRKRDTERWRKTCGNTLIGKIEQEFMGIPS